MIIGMQSAHKNPTNIEHLGWFIGSSARVGWSYRVELSILAVLAGLFAASAFTNPYIGIAITVTLCALIAWNKTGQWIRNGITSALRNSRTRRKLIRAASDADFPGLKVEKISPTLPGEIASVRIPRGQTVNKLESSSRAIAANLRASDVRVIHDRNDRSHAELSIIRRDAFESMKEMEWPLLNAERTNVREPMPMGRDEYGRATSLRLLSRNLLVGGAPDAGKSVFLRLPAAYAALDPKAKLWMMDAKTGGAEFVHWAPAAHRIVRGRNLQEAVDMLVELTERIEARGAEIVARGEVFVCDDMEVDVLMIDESPQFMRVFTDDSPSDQKLVKTIRENIWKLVALGRWTGVITIMSAQKPTADIVPSESRDLFDNKFALHCNTRQMSDAILGDGAGSEITTNAADIPSGQPGVGYLMGDHGVAKTRSFFLSHKQAMEIASRAAGRQMDNELRMLG